MNTTQRTVNWILAIGLILSLYLNLKLKEETDWLARQHLYINATMTPEQLDAYRASEEIGERVLVD